MLALLAITTLRAQSFRSFDEDRATLPLTTVGPNETWRNVASLVIRDRRVWRDGSFRVASGTSGRCNLILEDGGDLLVENGELEVFGDIYLMTGGTLQLIRTTCTQRNSFPRQYNYWWEGGHLYTKYATIGGYDSGSSQISNFWLNRGLWTARQTIVQHSGGILLGIFGGYGSYPEFRGGTLDADGIFTGQSSDAIVMLGHGDAIVRNSRFPMKLDLYADRAGSVSLDLTSRSRIAHRVIGDRNRHTALNGAAVTDHIPGSPWRLELENTIADTWALAIQNVRTSGPLFSVEMRNAEMVDVRMVTHDLQGSPTLTGPWRTYYPAPRALSDLPSARAPGEHGIPPGCGVRIGNAEYRAPANQWAYPSGWAFNFTGNANFSARGAMSIVEMYATDNAVVTFEGDGEFNAGMLAQTYDFMGNARVTMRNATIGNNGSFQASIAAYARAQCVLENCVTNDVLLHTERGIHWPDVGVNLATLTLSNYLEKGTLTTRSARTGSVVIQDPATSQNTDLSNLGFEGAVSAGRPDYWAVSGVTGDRRTTRVEGAVSYAYTSTQASGWLQKQLTLPQRSSVEFSGRLRLNQRPSGASIRAFVQGSSGNRSEDIPTLVVGNWVYFRTAAYQVRGNDTHVKIGIAHQNAGSGPLEVLCDDFAIGISSWWEHQNITNLSFENGFRAVLVDEEAGNAPDHWSAWQAITTPETVDLPPGGSHGSVAARVETLNGASSLRKCLPDLVPGNVVRVRGWIKPLQATVRAYVFVSELNNRFYDTSYGNNVSFPAIGANWQFFDLTYTVPSGSLREDLSSITVTSQSDYLIDGLTVEIQ